MATSSNSLFASKINKRLAPGQNGTKRYLNQYGNALVCVRYRQDQSQRYTTVEIVVDQRPDFAEARYHLAGVYRSVHQSERAGAELEAAVRLKPNYFEAHLALANLHRDCGRAEAAIASYQEAIARQPLAVEVERLAAK